MTQVPGLMPRHPTPELMRHGSNTGGHGRLSVPPSPSTGMRVGGEEFVSETTLDSGVRVLSERIPSVRSASVGVWVRQGGAHESVEEHGASHLLEHMVFKGTERRTAADIAMALEGLGGSLDAYTSREHTAYQARVLDENLGEALDVLSDMVLTPTLSASDLDLEREVVLEEIAQVEDTPDDQVYELHAERMWDGHVYGSPILGTKESVAGMSADTLSALHQRRYRGENLIVAAAGNVDHNALVDEVGNLFADAVGGEAADGVRGPEQTRSGDEEVHRESAQTHVVFGTDVPGRGSADRYPLSLASSALGGGMSSRLFQKVREEMGLCYSVYSYQSFYSASGVSGVYVGTRPATADAAVGAIRGELERLAAHGLDEEELEIAKRQMKGQVMLALESTGSRLYRLASFALHGEPFLTMDELLARIDSVTVEDVRRVSGRYFDPDRQMILRLGPK
jgi:predicted Zn-dependent peptidase